VRLEVCKGLVELVARARREGWDRRQDLLVPRICSHWPVGASR